MDSVILFALPGNEKLAQSLAQQLGCEMGRVNIRQFPDGETYVNIDASVQGKEVFIVATLDHPDNKFFALYFLTKTVKEFGAYAIRLIAPYLAYMRQDQRFQPGDCISSDLFAHLLSSFVDELITIDPHLHRHHNISELYCIPTKVLHASALIAEWITATVPDALLVGPDEESEQWVSDVARQAAKPYIILQKTRKSDKDVVVKVPEVKKWKGKVPVLVDDIISTGATMTETIGHLQRAGFADIVAIGVHGIFAGDAYEKLSATGARIVTTNSIPHGTNAIDVAKLIATSIQIPAYEYRVGNKFAEIKSTTH